MKKTLRDELELILMGADYTGLGKKTHALVPLSLLWNLRAALAAMSEHQETEWQPIETAPTGRPILAYCVKQAGEISGVSNCTFIDVAEGGPSKADYPGDGWWAGDGDYYATWVWPTHWMPLPDPPAEQK